MRSYLAPDIVMQIFSSEVTGEKKKDVMRILKIHQVHNDPNIELITSDFCILEVLNALNGKPLDRAAMLLFYEVVNVMPTSPSLRIEYMQAPKKDRVAKLMKLAGLDK